MADIFVSYNSKDRPFASKIVKALESEGFSVWWDQLLPVGSVYRDEILTELKESKCTVVVWSNHSVDAKKGKWVIQEAEEAEKDDKIVPVLIDNVQPAIGFRHIQTQNLINWHGELDYESWVNVVSAVNTVITGERPIVTDDEKKRFPYKALALLVFTITGLIATYLYNEKSVLTVKVVNEFKEAIPSAYVEVNGKKLAVNEYGEAEYHYNKYFGSEEAAISVTHLDQTVSKKANLDELQGAPVNISLASGEKLFKVSHYTAQGVLIDAIHRGNIPKSISNVFPKTIGVLQNQVWDKTTEVVEIFANLGNERLGASSYEISISGEKPLWRDLSEKSDLVDYKWVRDISGFSQPKRDLISDLGVDIKSKLGKNVFLVINSSDKYFEGFKSSLDEKTIKYLDGKGEISLNEKRQMSISPHFILDNENIELLLTSSLYSYYSLDNEVIRYLRFLKGSNVPRGFLTAHISKYTSASCGDDEADIYLEVGFNLPDIKLRVSVIENITNKNIPLSAIEYKASKSKLGIKPITDQLDFIHEEERSPLSGGVLKPGESFVVPKQLIVNGYHNAFMPKGFISNNKSSVKLHHGFDSNHRLMIDGVDYTSTLSYTDVTLDRENIFFEKDLRSKYVPHFILPIIETLKLDVNGIKFDVPEDKGKSVSVLGEQAWGSCPFVYVKYPKNKEFLNLGQVITNKTRKDLEGEDVMKIGLGFEKIEIREIEPETSYINNVTLVEKTVDGERNYYKPSILSLKHKDDDYLVLKQHESVSLEFPEYEQTSNTVGLELVVGGYYIPIPSVQNR